MVKPPACRYNPVLGPRHAKDNQQQGMFYFEPPSGSSVSIRTGISITG